MSCGVGHRHGSDLVLLWHRPAAAALIQPLALELPFGAGAALKRQKKERERKKERKKESQTDRQKERKSSMYRH